MQRLKAKTQILYREKRYEELFDSLSETDENMKLFLELCRHDRELLNWFLEFQKKILNEILNNSELNKIYKQLIDKYGEIHFRI